MDATMELSDGAMKYCHGRKIVVNWSVTAVCGECPAAGNAVCRPDINVIRWINGKRFCKGKTSGGNPAE